MGFAVRALHAARPVRAVCTIDCRMRRPKMSVWEDLRRVYDAPPRARADRPGSARAVGAMAVAAAENRCHG